MAWNKKNQKTVMFSGGGTGGSVTPLLAVADDLRRSRPDLKLVFVGTKRGPEKEMVAAFNRESESLEYIPLTSGKWRRYFSLYNFLDIFKVIIAWFVSLRVLISKRPSVIISAGAFVSVPLAWAAALWRIPVLIHQQDVRPGLANKLMAPGARVITVTFEKSLSDYGSRAVLIGNPIREAAINGSQSAPEEIRRRYLLNSDKPLVLVAGGGTGSTAINKLILKIIPSLSDFCEVLHLTGPGKLEEGIMNNADYQAREFVAPDELLNLIAASDLVVSRAGLATLTELSFLSKPAILIPIPDSHQEDNAAVFSAAQAAIVFEQRELTPDRLAAEIKRVLMDQVLRDKLSRNIAKVIRRGAAGKMAGLIEEILGK